MAESLRRFVRPLRRRDGDDCALCREPINFQLRYPDPMSVSVDHLIPRYYGGRSELGNLRLAHNSCNSRRGHGRSIRRKRVPVLELVAEPGEVAVAECWDMWSAGRGLSARKVLSWENAEIQNW